MSYNVRLEHFPGQLLAVVRRVANRQQLGAVIPAACGTVWNGLRAQRFKGAGRHVAVYLDEDFTLEVGVETTEAIAPSGEIFASSLRSGEVAVTTHFGPYQGLGDAHAAVQQWCAAHHRQTIRPCWEIYGHWQEEWNHAPEKIRTEVYYLLKPSLQR